MCCGCCVLKNRSDVTRRLPKPGREQSPAPMSRSKSEVAFAVAPRLLDRVVGGGVEVVIVKTEGKQIAKGRSQHSRPRCFAPQISSRTGKEATPGISPPYLSTFSVVFVVSA